MNSTKYNRTESKISTSSTNNNYLDSQLKQAALEAESDFDDTSVAYQYDANEPDENDVPDLNEGLKDAKKIFEVFFNNDFDEAFDMCTKYEKYNLYYSHVKTFLKFMYALFSLTPHDIKESREQIKLTLSLCQQKRRQSSIVDSLSSIIWRPNYDEFTDWEVHSELIYAELQVMQTLITFFGEQNLIALIKGAFRMRSANNAYKYCTDILNHRKEWESDLSKNNFESGVSFGNGVINLILSHLPTRILKLLAVAGFYGDHDIAMKELHHITNDCKVSVRYKPASIFLRTYNLYIEQMFGSGEGDLEWAESLVTEDLVCHPNGAFALFHSGRLAALKGKPLEAIRWFEKCVAVPKEWTNLDNACFWDLIWCHAIQRDWKNASKYAIKMRDNCNWSPATNQYQYACFLQMMKDEQDDPLDGEENGLSGQAGPSTSSGQMNGQIKRREINESDRIDEEMITDAMRKVPELKVRFAGKTIPPEKYAITKATRFIAAKEEEVYSEVLYPAFELFYVWNVFGHANGSADVLGPLLHMVNKKLEVHKNDLGDALPLDTYCYLLLIKGVIYRNLNQHQNAINCFHIILDNESQIFKDTYIPPHAAFELGLTYMKVDQLEDAKLWLEKARDNYTGFLIESMVHLRVHGALQTIKKLEAAKFESASKSKEASKRGSIFKRMSSTLKRTNSVNSDSPNNLSDN